MLTHPARRKPERSFGSKCYHNVVNICKVPWRRNSGTMFVRYNFQQILYYHGVFRLVISMCTVN